MKYLSSVMMIVFILSISGYAMIQEQAKEKSSQEQPQKVSQEQPLSLSTQAVTIENLVSAISNYVTEEAQKHGGYYLVVDDKTGDTLSLTLKKVHQERLATLGDNTYFSCADFETPDGKSYDLDIFMKGENAGDLKPTEVTVHKENGMERYTWSEEEGLWHKVPLEKEN